MAVEPLSGRSGWKVDASFDFGKQPSKVQVPSILFGRKFARLQGASYHSTGTEVVIDHASRKWTAFWR